MTVPQTAPRSGPGKAWRIRVTASAQLWLFNVLVGALVASAYLRFARPPDGLRIAAVTYLGPLTSAALLSVAPGVLLLVLARFVANEAWLRPLTVGVWVLLQVALFVDTLIYAIFRYHFNAMVWNVMTTPGSGDAVHIGARDWGTAALGAAVLFVLELWVFGRLLAAERRRRTDGRSARFLRRPGRVWARALVPLILVMAGVYAHADLYRDRRITVLPRLFPVFPELTVKRFARSLGFDLEERPKVAFASDGILLDYPKSYPEVRADAPRPNFVILVVDSLRADMVTPEVMPHTAAFVPETLSFLDHYSGGNATRFGIFSMIYGLHGSYWLPVYQEQRSPVLVDVLLELGYRFRILSSASMSYPEFRSTAWSRIEDQVEDRIVGEREGGRDDRIAERFAEWLPEAEASGEPFFCFALLDAPHQSYSFPPEEAAFHPYEERVEYVKVARADGDEETQLRLFNRYRNAVNYADVIVGRMLETLEEHGSVEDTVVIVTGDHGEEFWENGFFGHTSNFTAEQLRVPLLLRGPGVEPGVEARPTSHLDLPATLLEMAGADPAARAQWTLGGNLLALPPAGEVRDWRVASGWEELAICLPDAILKIPTRAVNGDIDVYDAGWNLVQDDRALLRREGAVLGALALECRRFLR